MRNKFLQRFRCISNIKHGINLASFIFKLFSKMVLMVWDLNTNCHFCKTFCNYLYQSIACESIVSNVYSLQNMKFIKNNRNAILAPPFSEWQGTKKIKGSRKKIREIVDIFTRSTLFSTLFLNWTNRESDCC